MLKRRLLIQPAIQHLELGGAESHRVAAILRACRIDNPCGLVVCPACREDQLNAFRQHLKAFLAQYRTITWMTVVLTQADLRQVNLSQVIPRDVLQCFRMMLRRAGLSHHQIIGILEVDWNEVSRLWEPHFHLFIVGPRPATAALKKWLANADQYNGQPPYGVYRPIHAIELTDLAAIHDKVDYATKFHPHRKWRYFRRGKATTMKGELHGTIRRDAMRWLAHPMRDFVLLQGVRLDSKGFRLLSAKPPKTSIRATNEGKGGTNQLLLTKVATLLQIAISANAAIGMAF